MDLRERFNVATYNSKHSAYTKIIDNLLYDVQYEQIDFSDSKLQEVYDHWINHLTGRVASKFDFGAKSILSIFLEKGGYEFIYPIEKEIYYHKFISKFLNEKLPNKIFNKSNKLEGINRVLRIKPVPIKPKIDKRKGIEHLYSFMSVSDSWMGRINFENNKFYATDGFKMARVNADLPEFAEDKKIFVKNKYQAFDLIKNEYLDADKNRMISHIDTFIPDVKNVEDFKKINLKVDNILSILLSLNRASKFFDIRGMLFQIEFVTTSQISVALDVKHLLPIFQTLYNFGVKETTAYINLRTGEASIFYPKNNEEDYLFLAMPLRNLIGETGNYIKYIVNI